MAEPTVEIEKQPTVKWYTSPFYLLGFLGIAVYAAWLFLSYFSPNPLMQPFSTEPLGLLTQMAMPTAAMLSLVVGWRFSDQLSNRSGRMLLLALGIALGPLSGLAPLLESDGLHMGAAITYLLSGVGYASLLLLWSTLLITLEHPSITIFLAAALILGSIAYIFIISLVPTATILLTAILPVVSAVLFFLSYRMRHLVSDPERAEIMISAAESDDKDPISWKLIADTLTYTPCLGIGVFFALRDIAYPTNVLCIGLATIVSCMIIIIDSRFTHILSSKMQLQLFLPLAALTVFPLSFLSGIWELIWLFLLFSVFMLSLVTNYSAISLCVRVFELSPIRVFSYGRAYNLLGIVLGFAFAAITTTFFPSGSIALILSFAALIFLFIIASAFILEDHYPVSSEVGDIDEDVVDITLSGRNLWEERCAAVAKRYGLSPRQTEVLQLLARGRNTSYIQETLTISPYTAKAHIYNIYQKMGIHSRQELLTLIEQEEY